MNKTEFFDLMTANRNYINRDSVVAINSRNDVYVKSVGIANTGISSHKTEAAALVACEKYSRWFAEWHHVAALEINATIDVINADKAEGDKVVMGINADIALNIAHAEALEINAAIDLMIDERDHVSNCSYEGFDEQDRLGRIGRGCVNELDKRLGESFAKVKAIALRLWEDGFVTYPPEDCGAEYAQCCIECRQQWVWGAA